MSLFSSPETGEGLAAALAWKPPSMPPCPMPNSFLDLPREMLRFKHYRSKHSTKGVPGAGDLSKVLGCGAVKIDAYDG